MTLNIDRYIDGYNQKYMFDFFGHITLLNKMPFISSGFTFLKILLDRSKLAVH